MIGMEKRERENQVPGTSLDSFVPAIQWGGYGGSGISGWWESRKAKIGHFFSQKTLASFTDSSTIPEICSSGCVGAYTKIQFHTIIFA